MNVFKRIDKALTKMRASWKESNMQAKRDAVRSSFYLDEKYGTVYVLHNGIAVAEFQPTENIETLTAKLESIRCTATKYSM